VHFALVVGPLLALGLTDEVHDWDLTTTDDYRKVSNALKGLDFKKIAANKQFR
jgi:hypothetical protein